MREIVAALSLLGFCDATEGVADLAVRAEIMDPRERRYLFVRPQDRACDLGLLRSRLRTLAHAPPMSDALWLPDRWTAAEVCWFNRGVAADLRLRMGADMAWKAPAYRALIAEVEAHERAWERIRDARTEYYYVTVRRGALAELRELVGYAAYGAHDVPSPTPYWRWP